MQPRHADRSTSLAYLESGAVEYRLERHGDATVLLFHGGHMRAGLALGEETFIDAGYSVLVPSRPGYGRTPLETGTSSEGFADVVAELCLQLGLGPLAAVVGVSGGGPTAIAMAARHPDLVERLILQSAVGFLPWPDRRTRIGARLMFSARTEAATWGALRLLLRAAPRVALRLMLRGVSTAPAEQAYAHLTEEDRRRLVALFSRMRSGRGFLNDLQPTKDVTCEVTQPALVIASRRDGGVPFAHAEALAASLPDATLVVSEAASHLIWFSPDYAAIGETIRDFLANR